VRQTLFRIDGITEHEPLFGTLNPHPSGKEPRGTHVGRKSDGGIASTKLHSFARQHEIGTQRDPDTFGLLQDDIEIVALRQGDFAGWGLRFANETCGHLRFMHELLLRMYWRMVAWLISARMPEVRFDLAFDCPPYAGSYRHVLPGPIQYSQPLSALWIYADKLSEPIRRDEAALHSFIADIQTNVVLPWRRDDDISDRVRFYLQSCLPVWPDLVSTASALHMSASTLQRQLAKEHNSFQSLKDELRRDMAILRLTTTNVQLTALAIELGFSDSAAFQRAFKSWTGSSPGTYRLRLD